MKARALLATLILGSGLCASTTPAMSATVPALSAPHRFFGLLQSVNGTAMILRLRNGRLLKVEAAEAFALERVSEPLFAGKATVVEGVFWANGVLHANVVKRAAPRPATWALDN